MERKCAGCANFERYYTKAYCRFLRENVGFCCVEQKVLESNKTCEAWRAKHNSYRKIQNPMMLKALKDGLTDIAAIAQIFEEEKDKGALS